ncbi:MAG: hypothetical protein DYG89_52645 [Caldilinea sp. CFX5]|nr:hypothetical protein [Caldilinea sp. CFX5]
MNGKRFHRIFIFLLFFSLLLPPPVTPVLAQVAGAPSNVQPYLTTLAATDPNEMVAVIVQKAAQNSAVEDRVAAVGGQVTQRFPIINAFAARLAAHAVVELAANPAIKWIALDAPVLTSNSTGLAAADDFVDVTYNGSTGAFAWAGDWQEIGESDGAALGDVAVTPFWGGALQGLRLQGGAKGALRPIDLANSPSPTLHLAYRRKGFVSEQDFVLIELSSDGGETWQEVGRLAGPVTDAEIQYVSYDIAAYRSAHTVIRLTTSPYFGDLARFYLDTINVDLLPATNVPPTNNQLYLPLVTQGEDHAPAAETVEASLSKAELIARTSDGGRTLCTYQCIDLTKLNSTFVKAIRTDQLWNVTPYLRGFGVTVAVVDSGIVNHPDLNDYAGSSRLLQRVNFVPNSNTPDDYYGHGTHIAGTIAGLGENSGRVYMGVAPEAKLVDVRVMNDRGHGNVSSVIAGLQWIYTNRTAYNIRVVNLSLNSRIPESYHKSALNAALEVLWFNNIVVVVSAGNGGKQRLYPPANDPFIITVGSVDDKGTVATTDDTLSPFSAYGMTADGFLKPDLVAPGSNIISILASDDSNLLLANPSNAVLAPNNSRYFKMSGTSMASAVVAGAVAVLLEASPSLTPDQVKYRLRATAQPFTGVESCAAGAGYLDIAAAVAGTTTQSANTGIAASQQLWSGSEPITWGTTNWNSVSWNTVSWNTVSWNTVSWNTVSWNTVSWNTSDIDGGLSSGSCNSAIAGLTLVNANTDQDVQPIYDGAVVNLDAIGTTSLNVRADVVGTVGSVRFTLAGSSATTRVENSAPYAMAGDNSGNYVGYTLGPGVYTLKAQAYTAANAGGAAGGTMEIQFTVAGANRCNVESVVRSKQNLKPVSLQVKNNSTEQLELFAINANGVRVSYGVVAPGQTRVQTTYDTHPWVIARDTTDACLHLLPNVGNEPEVSYPLTNPAGVFNGNYFLKALHSNKCADVDYGSFANGANISQYDCHGGNHQIWTLTPVSDGVYTMKALHSGKCMEVANASTANGANVQQNSCTGANNQRWRLEAVGGGAYKVTAVHSGQALNVWNGGTMNNITQSPYQSAAYQQWLIQPTN